MIRLSNELDRWIDATKVPQTLNGLKNLLIKEKFLNACDLKMAMYLREKEVADNTELAKTAERYMDAHCMLTMKTAKSQPQEVKRDKNGQQNPSFRKKSQMIRGKQSIVSCVVKVDISPAIVM